MVLATLARIVYTILKTERRKIKHCVKKGEKTSWKRNLIVIEV